MANKDQNSFNQPAEHCLVRLLTQKEEFVVLSITKMWLLRRCRSKLDY